MTRLPHPPHKKPPMKLPNIIDITIKIARPLIFQAIKYIVLPVIITTQTVQYIVVQTMKYATLPTITVLAIMSSIDAIFFQYIAAESIIFWLYTGEFSFIATESIILWLCIVLIVFILSCYCFYRGNKNQIPSHVIDRRINNKVESIIQSIKDLEHKGIMHKIRAIYAVMCAICAIIALGFIFFIIQHITIFFIILAVVITPIAIFDTFFDKENKKPVKPKENDDSVHRIVDSIAKSITQATKSLVIPTVIILIIAGIVDAIFYQYVIKERTISLAQWISGSGALVGLWLFFRRITNQDKQIDIQINKEIDDRFNAASELLGNSETSARTAGIYSLYQLAVEPKGEKYRVQAAQILCSHIRSKTQEPEYQKSHNDCPSNEIQTAIDILFKDINGVKSIYQQDFSKKKDFPRADLSHAYLQGANFEHAHCRGANFGRAQLQKAIFREAHCRGAYFGRAQLQKAIFREAQCQGADFIQAQCQGTYFYKAQCQGVNFREAQCQGADFTEAQCQGSIFDGAQCQGAHFTLAKIQGARFHDTQFQGVYAIELESALLIQLKDRIEKDTELETLQFEGPLDKKTIASIEKVKQDISAEWYEKMKSIIKKHENKEPSYTIPEGIITGILEDSKKLQDIIKELEAIEKQKYENL